jgi:hypothetical protein
MLKTKKLLRECGYKKLIIDETNKMTLVQPNGNSFIIIDNDDPDDDTIKEDSDDDDDDDDYIYNFSEEESKKADIMDVDEDKKGEEVEVGEEVGDEEEGEKVGDEEKGEEVGEEEDEEEGGKENEEESEEESEEEHLIPEYTIKLGQDLHILLQNINKIPTPPPTNNDHKLNKERYRNVLVNHLSTINNVDKFYNTKHSEIFVPVYPPPPSFRKSSLSFILNEEEMEEEEEVEMMIKKCEIFIMIFMNIKLI